MTTDFDFDECFVELNTVKLSDTLSDEHTSFVHSHTSKSEQEDSDHRITFIFSKWILKYVVALENNFFPKKYLTKVINRKPFKDFIKKHNIERTWTQYWFTKLHLEHTHKSLQNILTKDKNGYHTIKGTPTEIYDFIKTYLPTKYELVEDVDLDISKVTKQEVTWDEAELEIVKVYNRRSEWTSTGATINFYGTDSLGRTIRFCYYQSPSAGGAMRYVYIKGMSKCTMSELRNYYDERFDG